MPESTAGATTDSQGLVIERRFTTAGDDPYSNIEWVRRNSKIANPDGSVVFEMNDAEIPAQFSQVATDIIVSKYFRKAGVPQTDSNGEPITDFDGNPITGPERSAKDVFNRLAETWRHWGEEYGYFATAEDAQAFEDELKYMLANQMAAPNSPQWFNTGLFHKYGITGTKQGFWFVDEETGELTESEDAYSRPAPHACFPAGTLIQTSVGPKKIEDIAKGDRVLTHMNRYQPVTETMTRQVDEDLVLLIWPGAIKDFDLGFSDSGYVSWETNALAATANHPILAVQSQEGSDVTKAQWIPAAKLKSLDRVVIATEDGQTTEKVIVRSESFAGAVYNFQVDEDESYVANGLVVHNCFIQSVTDDLVNEGGIMDLWVREARLFKMGSGTGSNFSNIRAEGEPLAGGGKSSGLMSFLKIGDRAAGAIKSGGTTRRAAKMVVLDMDHPDIEKFIAWKKVEEDKARILIDKGGFPADFNGDAYATVSGQNSNNSVRVPSSFVEAVVQDGDWELTNRTDGAVRKTVKARDLWRQIADAAWACADPGVQFDTVMNEWHTCPEGGRLRATNPCAEFVFLDNSACNLSSLNLVKFTDAETGSFDIASYEHAVRLWTIVLEISVTMAHFPAAPIARGAYDYRTLGLGYANLGSLLMRAGLPYDSNAARAITAALTAIMTGVGYATSAEMAATRGPFPRFAENREHMLRVIRNHRRAAYNERNYEDVSHNVMGIDADFCPPDLLAAARQAWDQALALGEVHGYRNAQHSCIAPTGTIALEMDCDTTGIEPDFALVKFKKLAGGGYFKIVNKSVAVALGRLGYDRDQIETMIRFVIGTSSLDGAPFINRERLGDKGFSAEEIDRIETALPAAFHLRHAFNVFVVGEEALQRLGLTEDDYAGFDFDLLSSLGFTAAEIREANDHICGRQTIEGAPHLLDEHLPVFDCANRNGRYGERLIHHTGHLRMLAAGQPFLSGSASKTVNMPTETTVDEIEGVYMMSWELGIKAMALYRDGSKASQPLSSSSDDGDSEELADEVAEALQSEVATAWGQIPAGMSPTKAYANMPRPRFLLPPRRQGWTQEARIGGHKVFLRAGEYEDGTLGEIFIDLAKEGATLRGVLASFAIAVSKGLQYGVPLEEFVDTFTFQTFEPRGMVEGHPNIKMANSIIDYIFRSLGMEYLQRDELVQVPPDRSSDLPEPPKGLAAEAGQQLELTEAAKEADIDAQASAAAFADSGAESNGNGPAPTPSDINAPEVMGNISSPRGGGGLIAEQATKTEGAQRLATRSLAPDSAARELMGDAPVCSSCGHMTVRNGSCYVCLTCGDTTGCS